MKWIDNIRFHIEKYGFDVFYRLGNRLGVPPRNLRLFFIYISFFTLGLSFVLYIFLAFVLKVKDLIRVKRPSVFDL